MEVGCGGEGMGTLVGTFLADASDVSGVFRSAEVRECFICLRSIQYSRLRVLRMYSKLTTYDPLLCSFLFLVVFAHKVIRFHRHHVYLRIPITTQQTVVVSCTL